MLLEIGSQVDVLLRSGAWVRNMTVVQIGTMLTLQTTQGQTQTYNPTRDIAVIVKSTLVSL